MNVSIRFEDYEESLEEVYKMGIREVVAWVRANTKLLSLHMGEDLEMCYEWQQQLKEWGVNESPSN